MISSVTIKNCFAFIAAFYVFYYITPNPVPENKVHLQSSVEAKKLRFAFMEKVKECQNIDSITFKK